MKNVGDSHVRSKNCPHRGEYVGKSFTINQMNTWIGYQHMAMENRGFRDEEYRILMEMNLTGLMMYHPYDADVDNEKGSK